MLSNANNTPFTVGPESAAAAVDTSVINVVVPPTESQPQQQQQRKPAEEDPFAPAEPAYVKDAKAILHAAQTVKPDEWSGFMDGLTPRLEDIKKANLKTYNHVIAKLGEIEAAWEIAA